MNSVLRKRNAMVFQCPFYGRQIRMDGFALAGLERLYRLSRHAGYDRELFLRPGQPASGRATLLWRDGKCHVMCLLYIQNKVK